MFFRRKNNQIFKGYVQIVLLVCSIFAFAYIIHETNSLQQTIVIKNNVLLLILKILIKTFFSEKTLVSAAPSVAPSDISQGIATCAKGKDGSVCQEYLSSECAAKCAEECVPTRRESVEQCKLGTCYDPKFGTCQERASKELCENKGGKWFDDPAGNIAECKKACCSVGDDVVPLITARECTMIGEVQGVTTTYRTDIKSELECLELGKAKVEGACMFTEGKCRFITKGECTENRGDFFEGVLCTHPDLGTKLKKQASARCFDDRLYWVDSEGNKENIYDANKARSWNNGNVLAESESCDLGSDLKNQKTCGNCDRLFGSVCGQKTQSERLSDSSIDFVCKDMRCTDGNGNIRENGESWCEYQGAIGTDKGNGGFDRSVETPGSRHFRAVCIDGEVEVDACADYRNEICIEDVSERTDGEDISTSACVTNLWQLCLNYNSEVKGEGEERTKSLEVRDKKCTENPHCILKKTEIADKFRFNLCAPKYAPGFDLQRNADAGELSCAFASQKCTVISVKKIGGWKVEVNEGCLKPQFAEQMNDLCMSLGDCGASVNYAGELTENYKVFRSPKLGKAYLDKIRTYSDVVQGKYIEAGDTTKYLDAIGGIEALGGEFKDPIPGVSAGGTISGVSGAVLAIGTAKGVSLAIIGGPVAGLGGVLAGAAIGFAVTALLIKYTGIGGGLDPAVAWALIAAGALAGALIGATFVAGSLTAGVGGLSAIFSVATFGVIPIIGWIILIIVIIIIVIFTAIGVGDVKKRVVEFQCRPWQPPLGGESCGECGADGYPCSPYSCQALGQTCRLINEDSIEEKCVDISPNDIISPIIKPWEEVLSEGYKYEQVSDNGFKVLNENNDGCVASYNNLVFGIELNEPGYCKYDIVSKSNFDEMEFDFGDRNLFIENHAQFFTVPDLTSLGAPGFDPSRRADFNFHVRCIDGNGNGKDSREYLINLCVKPGEDKTPPAVTRREPLSEFVRFDAKELDAKIFVNEPATCKWSLNDVKYEDMNNQLECENDVVDRSSIFGWECKAKLPITKDENTFFVKCKDQPWHGQEWQGEGDGLVEKDESKRNEMTESYQFIVKRTKTPLKIDYTRPNNETLRFGVEPATVILEVGTSGGIDNRATCKLFGKLEMSETFGRVHKQIFSQIFSGDYEFPIICEDMAGNTAETISKFKVELDAEAPKITRVYSQSGDLIVITDEDAECRFIRDKAEACSFEFINGSIMSGVDKIHSTFFDGNNYYVKCKDGFGNIPGECSIIVKKGAVINE